MPFPRGKSTFFFFFFGKGKKYFPAWQAARLPSSLPQRRLMLNSAQERGHSVGFSFSPSLLSGCQGPEGLCHLQCPLADVQCPRGRCAPAPCLPPGPCYCRYQAGGGSLARRSRRSHRRVCRVGSRATQTAAGGNQLARGQTRQPFAPHLIGAGRSSSSSSGKGLLHVSHVPLTSLAGGGGDEPGMPGQLPLGISAGG